ncbi:MAG: hypothetical protein IPG99_15140 [Ignavibacteria bacterium]|nr:hypothetical protein [Ignavibacteria bacterium]
MLGIPDNEDREGNTIQFSKTDLKTFLHLYREQMNFRIFEMDSQGRLRAFTDRRVMETGWTSTKPFFLSEVPDIFRLKELGGQVNIYQLTETGKLKYEDSVWPEKDNLKSGWSTVEFFYLNNETFLFLLKELGGSARIHKMNGDGTVGTMMFDNKGEWQNGWTNAKFCQMGRSIYRVLLHKDNGFVRINKLKRNTGASTYLSYIARQAGMQKLLYWKTED